MFSFSCFQGSRYIFDLYYEKQAISKQLYEWLLKNNYADANLIAKWKKQGYEKVSVLRHNWDALHSHVPALSRRQIPESSWLTRFLFL